MQQLRTRLREIVRTRMSADPAHDLAHLDRVWANARTIARQEGGDLRILLGAVYLHDLVNLAKDDPSRHRASALSADAAGPILHSLNYNTSEIAAARQAILTHSFSAGIEPQSPEAEILRDADRLDALGAIGIARTFVVAGATGRSLYDPGDPFAGHRPLDDRTWSIDHWQVKLLQLPSDMLTDTGRKIAGQRVPVMLAYLKQLAQEIDTPLPAHLAT